MKHPVDQHVGRRLKQARQLRKLSQNDLAKRLNISFQQIQKYENGVNRIAASKLFEIAQILESPIAFFFDGIQTNSDQAPSDQLLSKIAKDVGSLQDEKIKKRVLSFINDVSDMLEAKKA